MTTDFRDGKTFPRRGRTAIGSALWLARVGDKARAAAAGTIHDYIYPCPMDQGVFARWGISAQEFEDALERHGDDEALRAWLTARVAPERIEEANRWLVDEKSANLDRQDAEEATGST
jgi:hypothetical protein